MAVFSGNGAVGSPSFTFSSDTDTGLYRVSDGVVGIATNGSLMTQFTSTGIGINTTPTSKLHIHAGNNLTTNFPVYIQNSADTAALRLGAYGYDHNLYHIFNIGGNEVVRIDGGGRFSIGTPTGGAYRLTVRSNAGSDTAHIGISDRTALQATATFASAIGHHTAITSADAAAITNMYQYYANGTSLGIGATITDQYGYYCHSSLTTATNNYAFYTSLSSATGRWAFYGNSSAPNYFGGDTRCNAVISQRSTPTNSNVTATASAGSLRTGIRTGTPAANIDLQVPTGTNLDAGFQELQDDQGFEWSVINLAPATYTITVTSNTDHSLVGNMVVDPATSGRFLSRKTATGTFVTYRIA